MSHHDMGIDPKKQAFLDKVGELSDRADNFTHSAKMPGLPASIHISCLADGMASIRDELRQAYVEFTEKDPWAEPSEDDEGEG